MNAYPRAFRFRRVPAAPPRMTPVKHTFHFNQHDLAVCRGGEDWVKMWNLMDNPSVAQTTDNPSVLMRIFESSVKQTPRHQLFGYYIDLCHENQGEDLKVTMTRKSPRISAKLATTFPWKLRKYLKKP